MGYYFSNLVLLAVVLSSTFTSALVVPRGHRPVVSESDAFDSSGQDDYPSDYLGTGYPNPTTIASSVSTATENPSLSMSCNTSLTATVTTSGWSIEPLASKTGYYSTSAGSTIYAYPTNPSPSPEILSSTMGYPAGPFIPPPENPMTSEYPNVFPTSMVVVPSGGGHDSVISSAFNTPIPYQANYPPRSVAPFPTASLPLQGAQFPHNTYPTGTAPISCMPIWTGYTTSSAYGTGDMPPSNVSQYPMESAIYNSDTSGFAVYPTSS